MIKKPPKKPTPKRRFKFLCKKCKTFYLPDASKISKLGYCENCRMVKGRCKFITEIGYQCENEPEVTGYCTDHFLTLPIKELRKHAKKL
ncbi:MAG: hypothetical protein Q7R96_04970 [Nanoarchaeota archaeon]|nr:hypothetical protein [Nanoarchaeota archaeon]